MYKCASCGSVVDGQRFCANCGMQNINFDSQLTTHSQANEQQSNSTQQNHGQYSSYGQPQGYGQQQNYGQQQSYDQQQNYGQYQNHAQRPTYPHQERSEWRKFATAALVCGIVAMTIPIPIFDLIAGIAAIILIVKSSRLGGHGGLHITALVFTIIGTFFAFSFTVTMLFVVPFIGGILGML